MKLLLCLLLVLGLSPFTFGQNVRKGTILTKILASTVLLDNRIGLDPNRTIKVYLPASYTNIQRSYPVLYYCHSTFTSAEKQVTDGRLVSLLERGFDAGVLPELIVVVADYSTPTTGSIYENSPVSGRWLDFTTEELIPFIDRTFRTLPHRNSRAVAGDFFGGRGALKLAMTHANRFSVAYALHPVATGTGPLPWATLSIDWPKIHAAKSFADLGSDHRTRLFVTISQAFAPNLNSPPLYCDFFVEKKGDAHALQPQTAQQVKAGFLLEETLVESATQLRTLRGLGFDWGRFDQTQDHIYANQAFSRRLEDLGIEHEAEEYRGDPWNRTWTDTGRFYTRLLPFLARHLVFEPTP